MCSCCFGVLSCAFTEGLGGVLAFFGRGQGQLCPLPFRLRGSGWGGSGYVGSRVYGRVAHPEYMGTFAYFIGVVRGASTSGGSGGGCQCGPPVGRARGRSCVVSQGRDETCCMYHFFPCLLLWNCGSGTTRRGFLWGQVRGKGVC